MARLPLAFNRLDRQRAEPRDEEAAMQRRLILGLRLHGWAWWHTRTMIGTNPGLPDLWAWRPEVLNVRHGRYAADEPPQRFWAELKADGGRLMPEQMWVLYRLWRQQTDCLYIWRPRDEERANDVIARRAHGDCLLHTDEFFRYEWITEPPRWLLELGQPEKRATFRHAIRVLKGV